MYKHSTNGLPNVFNDYFVKHSDIHSYPTRRVNDLNLTKNKKSFSDNAVRTTGPILLKSINKTLKLAISIKHFREKYKRDLLTNYN